MLPDAAVAAWRWWWCVYEIVSLYYLHLPMIVRLIALMCAGRTLSVMTSDVVRERCYLTQTKDVRRYQASHG